MNITQLSNFAYLDHFIELAQKGLPWYVNEINQVGTRKSGKDEANKNLANELMLSIRDFTFIPVLKTIKLSGEQWDACVEPWQEIGLRSLRINHTKKTIRWQSKNNEIRVIGLQETHSTHKGKIDKLKGIRRYGGKNKKRYGIIWFNEADLFTKDEINATMEAVSGIDNLLVIYSANPWLLSNWYIAKCNKLLPFNRRTMLDKKDMFKQDNKIITHYSNWELNNHLSLTERDYLYTIRQWDPKRADIVSICYPGNVEGMIYGDYTDKIRWFNDFDKLEELSYQAQSINAGLDWGKTKARTELVIGMEMENGDDVWIDNYIWDNDKGKYKSSLEVCEDIIDWLIEWATKLEAMVYKGFIVDIDNAEATTKDYLNNLAESKGVSHWLSFRLSIKLPIIDRIAYQQAQLGQGKQMAYDTLGNRDLVRQYEESYYDKLKQDANGRFKRFDGNDDGINADEYRKARKTTNWLRNNKLYLRRDYD